MDTDQFTDREILAKTCWGEFRSGGEYGMQSILNTVQNRLNSGVTWWEVREETVADTLRTICLFHSQYSCWNANDSNRPKLMEVTEDDPQYAIALGLSDQLLAGNLVDVVANGDSYFDHRIPNHPAWAANLQPCAVINPHWYYRTVNLGTN